MIITPRRLAFAAASVLVLAACGSDDGDPAADGTVTAPPDTTQAPAATEPPTDATFDEETTADETTADGTTADGANGDTEMDMTLPDFATGFQLALTSDAAGTTVTENEVTIDVAATGYELSCGGAGKAVNDQFGHYHVLLDGALVDMRCEPTTSISMQNVAPGPHTIAAVPAINNHMEVMDNMQMIEFTYEPSDPLPEIVDASVSGDPAIRIVSPQPGEVVSGEFDVVVEIDNYELSCDLYGKPGLIGIGHYHMHLDNMDGPMMGMGTMMGMACTTTFTATTDGLESGATHTLIAQLADNGHAPLMNAAPAMVEVTVG